VNTDRRHQPQPPHEDRLQTHSSTRTLTLLEREIERADRIRAVRREATGHEIRHRIQVLTARRLTSLGHPTIEQACAVHEELREVVHGDIAQGATVHRRVPRLIRGLPWAVAGLDGLIIYLFSADLFNVPPRDLSANGLAAISLAVLGSAIAYAWLSLTGTRLRDFRTRLGAIAWRLTDAFTRFLVAIAVLIAAAMTVLMYQRVLDKATFASGTYLPEDQIGTLALVFAVLSLCANLTVVAAHALDGSAMAAELRQVGRALRRYDAGQRLGRRLAFRRALGAWPSPHPLHEREYPGVRSDALEPVVEQVTG